MFLLFAPVDAAAQHVVRAALDEFPDHLGFGEVLFVARGFVDIAEIDAQPDVVVVKAVRSGSRIDIGGVSRGHARRVEVFGQPRQYASVEHAAVRRVGFENRIHGREGSRKGPEVGIGIGARLIRRSEVARRIIHIERIVLAQQTVFGHAVMRIYRIERRLCAIEVAGVARRASVVAASRESRRGKSHNKQFLHHLSVILQAIRLYTMFSERRAPG